MLMPFFIKVKPVADRFQASAHGYAAALGEQLGKLGGEEFFKPDVAPPTDV